MWEKIVCNLDTIFYSILGGSFLIQIAPIKINPWSVIGQGIKRILLEDITARMDDADHENEKTRFAVMRLLSVVAHQQVQSWRNSILDFANSCKNGRRHSQEEFANFFRIHDDYANYMHSNHLENGQVDTSYKRVCDIYEKCLKEDDY